MAEQVRSALQPRHPEVVVELIGRDGNAFSVLGTVQDALERAGVAEAERKQFIEEATAGDYEHLLRTVLAWVEVA